MSSIGATSSQSVGSSGSSLDSSQATQQKVRPYVKLSKSEKRVVIEKIKEQWLAKINSEEVSLTVVVNKFEISRNALNRIVKKLNDNEDPLVHAPKTPSPSTNERIQTVREFLLKIKDGMESQEAIKQSKIAKSTFRKIAKELDEGKYFVSSQDKGSLTSARKTNRITAQQVELIRQSLPDLDAEKISQKDIITKLRELGHPIPESTLSVTIKKIRNGIDPLAKKVRKIITGRKKPTKTTDELIEKVKKAALELKTEGKHMTYSGVAKKCGIGAAHARSILVKVEKKANNTSEKVTKQVTTNEDETETDTDDDVPLMKKRQRNTEKATVDTDEAGTEQSDKKKAL